MATHFSSWLWKECRRKRPLKEEVSSLIYVIHDLNRFGITSVVDATSVIGYPQGHSPLRALVRDNLLNVRFPFVDLGFGDPTSSTWVDAEIKAITRSAPIRAIIY